MPQPSDPPADTPYTDGVKVIGQRIDSDGTVLVTFALAPGSPVIIRMPYEAWVSGDAHSLIPALGTLVQRNPQRRPPRRG